MMKAPKFTAIGDKSGWKIILILSSTRREGPRLYMTTRGAGAYLVDPTTGICEGTEGTRGYTLQLVPSAIRRLRKIERDRIKQVEQRSAQMAEAVAAFQARDSPRLTSARVMLDNHLGIVPYRQSAAPDDTVTPLNPRNPKLAVTVNMNGHDAHPKWTVAVELNGFVGHGKSLHLGFAFEEAYEEVTTKLIGTHSGAQ